MSGYGRSTKHIAVVNNLDHSTNHTAGESGLPARDRAPQSSPDRDPGRRLAAFAGGSVLVIGAVAALHNLYRSGDGVGDLAGWVGLLLLALTALGGGIKLAMWGARPAVTAFFDRAKDLCAEPVQAVAASGAVGVGALGMWWTFRGGYTSWWQHLTGESQWSLSLGVGQMLVAVLAGAALFTGGWYVTGLVKEVLTDSGLLVERGRADHRGDSAPSHPALLAALIVGGAGLVVMADWLTPKLAPTISGADVLPAIAAIAAVLLWAIGSNLGWWKGLAGLWKWATDASHKAAATSGVVALLMFSAGGLGLGWFTPATVPQAHAQCPPDCGGGSNGANSYGPDASQFQPPQMPNQMPDYQGANSGQPGLDQSNGISIYNQQPSQSWNASTPNNGGSPRQGLQPGQNADGSWQQAANGESNPPDYQTATPYTQGPGAPNPNYNGGQTNPGTNAGSQGGQANNDVQQPAQQPQQSDQRKIDDLTRQLQDQQRQSGQDQQRLDDLTNQLQQQKQNQQQLPKFPSKDKKKDDKDDQQDRDKQSGDNDLTALLFGAASSRRRKQDQQQGPDTQALNEDTSQAAQTVPGGVVNTVSDSVNLAQSSGQAAQGFSQAASSGASLASAAQSGAINPMDVLSLIQGISTGIAGVGAAVAAGAAITGTGQQFADQALKAVGDANPTLKSAADQLRQANTALQPFTGLVGTAGGATATVAGLVSTLTSLGVAMPDYSGLPDPPPMPDPNSWAGQQMNLQGDLQLNQLQQDTQIIDAVYHPDDAQDLLDGTGATPWSESEMAQLGLTPEQLRTPEGLRLGLFDKGPGTFVAIAGNRAQATGELITVGSEAMGGNPPEVQQAVSIVQKVVDARGAGNVMVLGHSMGGGHATAAAMTAGTYAQIFQSEGPALATVAAQGINPMTAWDQAGAGQIQHFGYQNDPLAMLTYQAGFHTPWGQTTIVPQFDENQNPIPGNVHSITAMGNSFQQMRDNEVPLAPSAVLQPSPLYPFWHFFSPLVVPILDGLLSVGAGNPPPGSE